MPVGNRALPSLAGFGVAALLAAVSVVAPAAHAQYLAEIVTGSGAGQPYSRIDDARVNDLGEIVFNAEADLGVNFLAGYWDGSSALPGGLRTLVCSMPTMAPVPACNRTGDGERALYLDDSSRVTFSGFIDFTTRLTQAPAGSVLFGSQALPRVSESGCGFPLLGLYEFEDEPMVNENGDAVAAGILCSSSGSAIVLVRRLGVDSSLVSDLGSSIPFDPIFQSPTGDGPIFERAVLHPTSQDAYFVGRPAATGVLGIFGVSPATVNAPQAILTPPILAVQLVGHPTLESVEEILSTRVAVSPSGVVSFAAAFTRVGGQQDVGILTIDPAVPNPLASLAIRVGGLGASSIQQMVWGGPLGEDLAFRLEGAQSQILVSDAAGNLTSALAQGDLLPDGTTVASVTLRDGAFNTNGVLVVTTQVALPQSPERLVRLTRQGPGTANVALVAENINTAACGMPVSYQFRVDSTGTTPADNVSFQAVLPPCLTHASCVPTPDCNVTGSQVDFAVASLLPGASTTLSIIAEPTLDPANGCGVGITLVGSVGASNDSIAGDNIAVHSHANDCAANAADLTVHDVGSFANGCGVPATLAFEVENVGPGDATNATLDVPIPACATDAACTTFGGQPCSVNAGVVTASLGTIASGDPPVSVQVDVLTTDACQPSFDAFAAVSADLDLDDTNDTSTTTIPNTCSSATCTLEPAFAFRNLNEQHTVTLTAIDGGQPLANAFVSVSILSGPTSATLGFGATDMAGQFVTMPYTGAGPGIDRIVAQSSDAVGVLFGCQAGVQWADDSDVDNDGVPDGIEDAAPGGGDGNGDLVPDSSQPAVASFPNSTDGRYVTLAASAGTLTNVTATPVPANAPVGPSFDFGVFGFSVEGLAVGQLVTVDVYLEGSAPPSTWYKFPATAPFTFLFDGTEGALQPLTNPVVLSILDGGVGDLDGVANGTIVDPGAPAFAPEPSAGALAAACLLTVAALRRSRRLGSPLQRSGGGSRRRKESRWVLLRVRFGRGSSWWWRRRSCRLPWRRRWSSTG